MENTVYLGNAVFFMIVSSVVTLVFVSLVQITGRELAVKLAVAKADVEIGMLKARLEKLKMKLGMALDEVES